jgi:rhamnogalacturonan endolyase
MKKNALVRSLAALACVAGCSTGQSPSNGDGVSDTPGAFDGAASTSLSSDTVGASTGGGASGSSSSGSSSAADGMADASGGSSGSSEDPSGDGGGSSGLAWNEAGASSSSGSNDAASASSSSSGPVVGEYDSGIPTTASCPTPAGAPVTLTQSGGSWVVSNGLVTITIPSNGNLSQVSKNGHDLMSSGETMYVSEAGGASYHALNATSHTIVRQTPEIVELSFVDTSGAPLDMDWDLHYVMRQGVSGFYYFLGTAVGTPTHPKPATLSELRTVERFDETVLTNGYVGERYGLLPQEAQLNGTEVQNAAYLMTVAPTLLPTVSSLPGVVGQNYDEGPVFTKYDWSTYRTEDSFHGLYGSGFGVWMLSPSWEFYTGGPLKQELMVQDGTLLLNMYHGGHAGSAITTPSPAQWQKLYGPNLVYVNTGTAATVLADARTQLASEQAQWPYCWMVNGNYPSTAQRGTVTGTVVEAHGRSVAGAVVALAQPGPLLTQGYDYIFWTQADSIGHFMIPAVRAGSYSVHVYATQGTIVDDPTSGEVTGTVTVKAGTNDVGVLTWSPPYHANLLWSIGTSDRKSGEFRVFPSPVASGPTNTAYETGRMYGPTGTVGIWTVPPAQTTYTIGTSTPQTDWYFAQSVAGTWTVKFNLASVPAGGAVLTIALAGAARQPHLTAAVNTHSLVSVDLPNDQSLYRSCLEGGQFQVITATVPATDLVAGPNTATFAVVPSSAGSGLFYDIVKLESD